MRRLQFIGLSLILFTGACASSPGRRGSQTPPKEPLRGGVAEFQVTSYDGEDIDGRVLVGATIDPLVIDGRFIPTSTIYLDWVSVRVCGTDKPPPGGVIYDAFALRPRPEEIVTIRPGYWYGRKINYGLFGKRVPGPECLEAEFVVRALD